MPRLPASTYRLQITPDLPLPVAARQLDYLHALGVDWVYLSPLLQATSGSSHGYDVVDHSRTDDARGGEAGLEAFADAAHARGMGVLVDIVPNHVGVAVPIESLWWWQVLAEGPHSPRASAFDIDWAAGDGKVILPILGDDSTEAVRFEGDHLAYYEHLLPIAAGSRGDADTPAEVLARQHYRLVNYRLADTELNYRRFFAVNELAALRVEDPGVFADSHVEIRRWLDAGWVDGLRVDHPDGLADPAAYFEALSDLSGGAYTVVEKILETGEDLPAWRCDGTTGYDALAEIDRVLVDPAGRAVLIALDAELRGAALEWGDLVHDRKRAMADGILGSEIRRLARLLPHLDTAARRRDAIAEVASCFEVYRSYSPADDRHLRRAFDEAAARRPDLADLLASLLPHATDPTGEFARRLQQTTGSVMAKGVEDGAFYRYPVLTSLTEVGGDPSLFALSIDEFHAAQERRHRHWPASMTTLSTHDTKRGEDVRARIAVLAEIPGEWAELVRSLIAHTGFPDPVFANLLWQTAVGAWPLERGRLHDYALKAARESGEHTSWIDPDEGFENALGHLVEACYDDPVVTRAIEATVSRVREAGWSNALSAKLLQLAGPGVPDVYRGTELWRNDLVDPDNRRPFDPLEPDGAADLLAHLEHQPLPEIDATGAAKLLVTSRVLRARRDRREYFADYRPLIADGPAAQHLVAADRGGAITLATRLPVGLVAKGGWAGTTLTIPARPSRDAITGREVPAGPGPEGGVIVDLDAVLGHYPVALLIPAEVTS